MSTFSEVINAFTAGCSLIAAVATLLLVIRKDRCDLPPNHEAERSRRTRHRQRSPR